MGGARTEAVLVTVAGRLCASVAPLRYGSSGLEPLIRDHGLRVVGSEYALETVAAEFLDGT